MPGYASLAYASNLPRLAPSRAGGGGASLQWLTRHGLADPPDDVRYAIGLPPRGTREMPSIGPISPGSFGSSILGLMGPREALGQERYEEAKKERARVNEEKALTTRRGLYDVIEGFDPEANPEEIGRAAQRFQEGGWTPQQIAQRMGRERDVTRRALRRDEAIASRQKEAADKEEARRRGLYDVLEARGMTPEEAGREAQRYYEGGWTPQQVEAQLAGRERAGRAAKTREASAAERKAAAAEKGAARTEQAQAKEKSRREGILSALMEFYPAEVNIYPMIDSYMAQGFTPQQVRAVESRKRDRQAQVEAGKRPGPPVGKPETYWRRYPGEQGANPVIGALATLFGSPGGSWAYEPPALGMGQRLPRLAEQPPSGPPTEPVDEAKRIFASATPQRKQEMIRAAVETFDAEDQAFLQWVSTEGAGR